MALDSPPNGWGGTPTGAAGATKPLPGLLPNLGADLSGTLARAWAWLRLRFAAALRQEVERRRPFLWLPVAAGAGAILNLTANREPSLLLASACLALFTLVAFAVRAKPLAFAACVGMAALFGGMVSTSLRTAHVAAPVLDRIRITKVSGWIEEWNSRREGARFVMRVQTMEGFAAEATPRRIRLTARSDQNVTAGTYVNVTARLLPPARASLPSGYDFARDAYFVGLGAVGSALGNLRIESEPYAAPLSLRAFAQLDQARNNLAARIRKILPGSAGAVAVAMVTGKRDYLDDDTKDLIREAGIFHIVTISGIQMTLVAGILFWLFRTGLSFSRTLALTYPIKIWAASAAMCGAILYDIGTGSRVGTERALWMTLILMGAVIAGRRAFSMRNLALAALLVIALEPEALLGASFQLSFSAVAALIAVWERRSAAMLAKAAAPKDDDTKVPVQADRRDGLLRLIDHVRHAPGSALFSTLCATSATASFMATNFHELSPYVLIGNPLTLIIIEAFAVPGALIGTLLYPLGLDGWVWWYVGLGIDLVFKAAALIASAPMATVHLPAFAPWTLPFLALGVLSFIIWQTWLLRLSAVPLLAIGLWGAISGEHFDAFVAPSGEAVALRGNDGALAVVGQRPSLFAIEQWLRADADGRAARDALIAGKAGQGDADHRCDALGCVIRSEAAVMSVVLDARAFAEDCQRADVIITPLYAPSGCAAMLVLDKNKLVETGAVGLQFVDGKIAVTAARALDEDRPWSPAPKAGARRKTRLPDQDWRDKDADDSSDAAPLQ